MKKKLIIVGIFGLLSLFLVAGTITLASTTEQPSVDQKNQLDKRMDRGYCDRSGHKMNKNGNRCYETEKGYHNENCDYYDDSTIESDSQNSLNKNTCHNEHNMTPNKHHNNGRKHMRMNTKNAY